MTERDKVAANVADAAGVRPVVSLGFMLGHWSRWLAFGFGSGLSPIAPGTMGTLWAWASFVLLDWVLGPLAWGILISASLVLGIWICEQAGRALGVSDHGAIVWDEIAAFWALLWLFDGGWQMQLTLFALFRLFDAWKPWPIRWFDRNVKGGFGVMLDDVIAAAAVAGCVFAWRAWL